jgi:hypothetical protein
MIITVAFTSPSFAEGLEILLHGGRSGVYQVNHYPSGVHHPVSNNNTNYHPKEISLSEAQSRFMHFPIYWPGSLPSNYELTGIYLYPRVDQSLFDGPIVDLEYDYPANIVPKGTGQIIIREFKPKIDMLQVVQAGSAYPLQVDQMGHARAIYVDGQWVGLGRMVPQWVRGGRSELIYQENGVIFWIVGDQQDGITKDVLMNIAQSLQAVNLNRSLLMTNGMDYQVQLASNSSGVFSNDLLWINSDDSSDPPYMTTIGNDQPSPNKPAKTILNMPRSS